MSENTTLNTEELNNEEVVETTEEHKEEVVEDAKTEETLEEANADEDIEAVINEVKSVIEHKKAESQKVQAIESSVSELTNEVKSKQSEVEAKLEEVGNSLKLIEKKLYRTNISGTGDKMTEEVKDFTKFLRTNEMKYLRTDRDPDGGYLVPTEMSNQIIHKIVEISDLRRLARVVAISTKAFDAPTGESDVTAYFINEGGTATETEGTFGMKTIPAHKLMVEARMTNELLADAAFDVVNDLNMRAALKFAQAEGTAFIKGTGVGEPEGIMVAAGISSVNSGDASEITADGLIDLIHNFEYTNNRVLLMNRQTLGAVRKLKTGTGEYLLDMGLNSMANVGLNGAAGMILGVPVHIMQDMPNVGAGNYPIAILDPQEAYIIVDRVGLRVLRDDFTLASQDKVKFILSRRVGGGVVNPDAILKLKVSV